MSIPGRPVPAIRTMNATSFDRAAAIGAIRPPSLWPIRPIFAGSISFRPFRKATPASASPAKSSLVERGRRARRAADTAVIDPQHRDPAAGQGIGDDQERLVAQDRLVAVLRPRSP